MSFLTTPISLFPTKPARMIGEIGVQVVITESSTDKLTITSQPVQQGASITDHAFKEPTTFSSTIYFKDNLNLSLSKVYQSLLDLQISRVPFNITTPKRIYSNMLLEVLGQTTDKSTENCLSISFTAREVILVPVTTVQVPRTQQKTPAKTGKTENAGKKSAALSFTEGIKAVASKLSPF